MTFEQLREFLESHDNYTILTHRSPDGDTLGSGFALCSYLRELGKNANVINHEKFPERYNFLYGDYRAQTFEEKTVIAVDVADEKLLGENLKGYFGRIDLCIDHHISNTYFAKQTLADPKASAAALVLYEFFRSQDIVINDTMAKCLYTGISTDTGCFKFENTTPQAHMAAAHLMELGVDFAWINRKMFEIRSKTRLLIEQKVTSGMEYYFDDRCSVICVTCELMNGCGVEPAEFEGLASIPLSVETVLIGITIKQQEEKRFKLSVRTVGKMDASAFCRHFGGGGHIRAAGCEITGTLDEVKQKVLAVAEEMLSEEKP